jgi:glycosyltransferase involved in cell wall biosynthesis
MDSPASTLTLMIPALNEAEAIGHLFAALPRHLFAQVLVVDNGSRDGTVLGSARAGFKILWTIHRCWRAPLGTSRARQEAQG